MAIFCSAGDTARVTFPDGSARDYTDTPIDIYCQRDNQQVNVTYRPVGTYSNGVPASFNAITVQRRSPFLGMRLTPGATNKIDFFDRGSYYYENLGNLGWRTVVSITGGVILSSVQLVSAVYVTNNSLPFRMVILGKSGSTIYNQIVTNCGYSVQCIRCPPNTLDCGDCCLPCDTIFNSISGIRKILSNI